MMIWSERNLDINGYLEGKEPASLPLQTLTQEEIHKNASEKETSEKEMKSVVLYQKSGGTR